MDDKQQVALAKMRLPFEKNQISILCRSTKKENPKGKCDKCGGWHGLPAIALEYVGHAALTHRLLDVDPAWSWEPLAFAPDGLPKLDSDGGMWIRLTVCGMTRLGYGDAQGKTGPDAMKERIGDALRNAAMRFGAALDLWHKSGVLDLEPERHSMATKWLMEVDAATTREALKTVWQEALKAVREAGDQDAYREVKKAVEAKNAELPE